MLVIVVMFGSSLKSWGMNCVGPSVLGFVKQWNPIRFTKLMAVRRHINQHGVRGETKFQNADHKIFESILGGFIKQHIQEKERATRRYCDSEACLELQTRERGSLSMLFFWLMCIYEITHLRVGNIRVFKLIDRDDIGFEVSVLSGASKNLICIV